MSFLQYNFLLDAYFLSYVHVGKVKLIFNHCISASAVHMHTRTKSIEQIPFLWLDITDASLLHKFY